MSRLFIISDVHGNLVALEAVLSQLARSDQVLCLGDVVGFGPRPRECVQRLLEVNATMIQGNHDRQAVEIFRGQRPDERDEYMKWTATQLTEEEISVLEHLPRTLVTTIGDSVCFAEHGDAFGYITPETESGRIAEYFRIGANGFDVILYGHSHTQGSRIIDGTLVISPGSVSYPRDFIPFPGYLVVEDGQWRMCRQVYDIEAAVADLELVPFSDEERARWAAHFRTGRKPPKASATLQSPGAGAHSLPE